ncbi:MAG: hypothetical protein ND895_17945 [Pyrinomonadaceae bacterium]|nr:hypothetical protein [Pyrinomonadaceae bacterium]
MSTAKAATPTDEDFGYDSASLARPSRHGLHAVSPLETELVIRPTFANKVKGSRMLTPKLTTEEFIQVRLATVRESTRHCYWPSEVVARFAAAEVIR